MEGLACEVEVIELNVKLIDGVEAIDCVFLRLLVVLVVVDVDEEMGDFVEELKVFVGVVVLVGLVVVLVADYAEQAEAVHCPLQDALALLHQVHALQQPRQLHAPQLNHAHAVHPLQLLDQLRNRLLGNVDLRLLCSCVVHEVLRRLLDGLSVLALGHFEDGVDDIEQFVEGHVVPFGDEAVEVGVEVFVIE